MSFALTGDMKRKGSAGGLLIDFLVPACLASRYRARLTALSPAEAELRLSFCPSIFRSGTLTCCPAEISAVFGAAAVRLRGSFHLEGGSSGTTARFRFDPPIALRDLELLQQASPEEAETASPSDPLVDAALSCTRESEPAWLQSTTTH
ncbi:MAG TPA: hypothetical protein VLF14_10335 [Candidatus Binatia bacterium]|nr:hypothetical protein [Candidatus Binatia bacterium]